MRIVFTLIAIALFLTSCRKEPLISITETNRDKILALQPLGDFNHQQLNMLRSELSHFFNIRVVILQPVDIPESFRNPYEEKYAADSLLVFLSNLANDTLVEIVGLTHKEIYTTQEHRVTINRKDTVVFSFKHLFGLGYIPGNSCVISDYRLMSEDKDLWSKRLKKVAIHEIGHNLGIPHCSVDTCLMSESNGDIVNLNKAGGDYCKSCRQKLN